MVLCLANPKPANSLKKRAVNDQPFLFIYKEPPMFLPVGHVVWFPQTWEETTTLHCIHLILGSIAAICYKFIL